MLDYTAYYNHIGKLLGHGVIWTRQPLVDCYHALDAIKSLERQGMGVYAPPLVEVLDNTLTRIERVHALRYGKKEI